MKTSQGRTREARASAAKEITRYSGGAADANVTTECWCKREIHSWQVCFLNEFIIILKPMSSVVLVHFFHFRRTDRPSICVKKSQALLNTEKIIPTSQAHSVDQRLGPSIQQKGYSSLYLHRFHAAVREHPVVKQVMFQALAWRSPHVAKHAKW